MPASRPDRSARRAFRSACLRLGFPLKEVSVLHTTTMPLHASTNAALHHAPTIAADHNLGAASVSHDPKISATVSPATANTNLSASTVSHDLSMTHQERLRTAVWIPNPNYPADPRPFCPPPLRFDPAIMYGLINAPTLFKAALPWRPPTPPLR
mmetsp:Transcript_5862/g.13000  ORF Transcript_5862/g.13000 Transcript_5862/m.13000 type:complete len:154 (+) Transcript_5862:1230-1691(+)